MPGPIRQNGKMAMFCNPCGEQLKEQTEIERWSCKCESHKKSERPCLATEALLSPLSVTQLPKGLEKNKILTFFAILSTRVTHNRKLLVVRKFQEGFLFLTKRDKYKCPLILSLSANLMAGSGNHLVIMKHRSEGKTPSTLQMTKWKERNRLGLWGHH